MDLTLVHARFIIPIIPEKVVLEHHSLVFDAENGLIIDILPTEEAKKKYPNPRHEFDRKKHILIPGLVNAHTHSPMTLLRGYADDIELMPWLQQHIWPAEQKWVSEEFVKDGTELALAEMLRSGTTCFNDMYFYPEISARVTADAGMRALIGSPILMFPTGWAKNPQEYLEKGMNLVKTWKNHNLVHISIAPHAPYTVTDEQLKDILDLSKKENTKIHMHIHETEKEVLDAEKETGERPIARLDKLGLIGTSLISVHMTQVNQDEIELYKKKQASVVHCPESNTKLASGFCSVHRLIENGINVCLGTDGAASNNDLDMLGEMRTAALLGKLEAKSAAACDAFMVLKMATINGAKALGMEDKIGSLEPKKYADFIAIKADDLESVPMYNPISHIIYVITRESVTDAWVAGKHLLQDRKLTTLDEQTIIHKANKWAKKLHNDKKV